MILRLRQARVEKHMKQQDVAEAIGVTRVTYARYEAGDREPDYDTLIKLTKLFDVTVDYLLGLTDIPNIYVTTGVGRLDATTYTTEKSLSLQEQKQAEKTIDYALNDGQAEVSPALQRAIEQTLRRLLEEQGKQA